ncbi:MAG: glycosyltransferase family 9 protein [Candidatus Omnitrophica bacterium]|nr:glycosyltransferase family 9 protein [Candidatus Omnitrophota bacterium]MCM8831986.1 glycosyltransferase family 9 protein [Candidatus Omnitrophota bacterium]
MKKILLINPFGIGDVLFTTPIVRAIKESYPEIFLGYWCNERVEPILKKNPFINKTFALSRGDLKKIFQRSKIEGINKALSLLLKVKKENFNIAIDFSLDHRYGLVCRMAGIRKRIGLNYKNRPRFLTDKIDIEGFENKHVIEYYLEVLKFLKIKAPQNIKLEIFLDRDSLNWADDFLKEYNLKGTKPLIGIAPYGGASWGKQAYLKYWPLENYIELIRRLSDKFNTSPIIFSDEEEKETANVIEKEIGKRIINLAGKLSLMQYLSLLSKLDILITNDSGNVHMAVALGIKTVSIFGPVDEKVYGPYPLGQNNIVIKKDFPCRPCYKKFRILDCQDDLRCLKSINTEEVYLAVEKFLS